MPDFITLSCPACGGKLEITFDLSQFACAQCGSELVVRRTSSTVSLVPVLAERGMCKDIDERTPSIQPDCQMEETGSHIESACAASSRDHLSQEAMDYQREYTTYLIQKSGRQEAYRRKAVSFFWKWLGCFLACFVLIVFINAINGVKPYVAVSVIGALLLIMTVTAYVKGIRGSRSVLVFYGGFVVLSILVGVFPDAAGVLAFLFLCWFTFFFVRWHAESVKAKNEYVDTVPEPQIPNGDGSQLADELERARQLAYSAAEVEIHRNKLSLGIAILCLIVPFLGVGLLLRDLKNRPRKATYELLLSIYPTGLIVFGIISAAGRDYTTYSTRTSGGGANQSESEPSFEAWMIEVFEPYDVTSVDVVGGTAIIYFDISDNLSEDMVVGGAKADVMYMLRAIDESDYDYSSIRIIGSFPMTDRYGGTEPMDVIDLRYSRSTIDQVNWSSFLFANTFDIADSRNIHPAFQR